MPTSRPVVSNGRTTRSASPSAPSDLLPPFVRNMILSEAEDIPARSDLSRESARLADLLGNRAATDRRGHVAIDFAHADVLLRLRSLRREITAGDPAVAGPFAAARARFFAESAARDDATSVVVDRIRRLGERAVDAAIGLRAAASGGPDLTALRAAHDAAIVLEYAETTGDTAEAAALLAAGLGIGFARQEARARWRADAATATAINRLAGPFGAQGRSLPCR